MPWASVRTIDAKAPWSFRLFGLSRVEALQAGEENTRIALPAVNGEELITLSRLWQAGTRPAPSAVHQVPLARPDGTLIYRSSAKDLFIASFAYGQFAVVGASGVLGLIDMLDALGTNSVATLSSLGPVFLGTAALIATILFGFVLTFVRYSGFEARTHLQGGVVIRYGLLSRHERFLDRESIAGVVLQRNLAEMLLGRIRLSLLTADSTAQLGSNLVLPSLPLRVVAHVSTAAFGDRTPSAAEADSRFPVVLSSVLWITATFGIPAIVMLAVAGTADYPAYVVLACGALMLAAVYGLGRTLTSRLAVHDRPGLVTVATTHISERRTSVSMPAIHLVTTSSVPGIARMVRIYFYAGMSRRLTCVFFTTEDVLKIQRRLVELSPSVALTKRERTRGRD
ncbi:hypothetical protein [Arthrobacter oryzae]|uniref:hypothetical protein n=1 Tax=Arthrobacter oryzae TaxID=409290 RepID=UPI0028670D9B|nr:hypothetical protein [Arthrobacter oryzae]MDR6504780.1 putative membrane protein [Arthrobacter oryzae]